ncbi:hypothetical protein Q427_24160 [Halomonas sp. BC04]|nr:hypothetical protein Q427_24160 [Halomonas sp. BC04]
MASISSLGIGSGLDLNGLLDQLNDAERGKLEPIERQIESQQVQLSAYGELQGALSGFQGAVSALDDPSLFQSLSADVSGEAVQAAAGPDASPGRYDVEVQTLASAGSYATARLEGIETLDDVVVSGGGELRLQFDPAGDGSGPDLPINIAADSTLADIRDAINAEQAGVSASIVNDGEGYRLALMSTETGKEASITGMDWGDVALADGVGFSDTATAVDNIGKDAQLTVNGIDITSAPTRSRGRYRMSPSA